MGDIKKTGRPKGAPRSQVTMTRQYAQKLLQEARERDTTLRALLDELVTNRDTLRDAAREMLQVLIDLDLANGFDDTDPVGLEDANTLRTASRKLYDAVNAAPSQS